MTLRSIPHECMDAYQLLDVMVVSAETNNTRRVKSIDRKFVKELIELQGVTENEVGQQFCYIREQCLIYADTSFDRNHRLSARYQARKALDELPIPILIDPDIQDKF